MSTRWSPGRRYTRALRRAVISAKRLDPARSNFARGREGGRGGEGRQGRGGEGRGGEGRGGEGTIHTFHKPEPLWPRSLAFGFAGDRLVSKWSGAQMTWHGLPTNPHTPTPPICLLYSCIDIWLAFRESQCRVCIKNVTNVPTRTFCFVSATQIPQGKTLLLLTHNIMLAITVRMWITFRDA